MTDDPFNIVIQVCIHTSFIANIRWYFIQTVFKIIRGLQSGNPLGTHIFGYPVFLLLYGTVKIVRE